MKMIGRKHKPFCGDCCSEYKKGSGKAHKRKVKKVEKATEKREWKQNLFNEYGEI